MATKILQGSIDHRLTLPVPSGGLHKEGDETIEPGLHVVSTAVITHAELNIKHDNMLVIDYLIFG